MLNKLTEKRPLLASCRSDLFMAFTILSDVFQQGGKLLVCGNGGSSADADHIVGELMKSFEIPRPIDLDLSDKLKKSSPERGAYLAGKLQAGLPAVSLSAHTALYTAISNDIDPDLVFAQQIVVYGNPGDVLLALSTSGNARNVIDAVITAKAMEMKVIGLTGITGGKMKKYCDIAICIPSSITAEIQEYHLSVYHTLCRMLELRFFM